MIVSRETFCGEFVFSFFGNILSRLFILSLSLYFAFYFLYYFLVESFSCSFYVLWSGGNVKRECR
ncbi:hypothetical protein HMPREF9151_02447 [Hoylesella saccharolytica F0055]|uniref:Uncharacterized protein n=1 Tax=Hoylesella saccharolytica F0055 TaxID=1127699 RepID=L1MZ28_9BACT|nr:hypothetical protein HMPREF9151_02447 [Hoylesella saccharolytica F0055]